ncbi:MAG: hypothetical protein KDA96_08260 [Planctomycetaceae bacterium]|nr:hypothetical protein [Planctomycetaceae bacterium]
MPPREKENIAVATQCKDPSGGNAGIRAVYLLISGLLIHLIVLAVAFVLGFVFGASLPLGHAPTAAGFTGGVYALQTVLLFYIASAGIIPLVLSVIGSLIGRRLLRGLDSRQTPEPSLAEPSLTKQRLTRQTLTPPDAAVKDSWIWTVALWAAGMELGCVSAGYGYMALQSFIETGFTRNTARWSIPLLIAFWGTGAVVAYLRHRSWQVSVALVAMPFLLRMLTWFVGFPREGIVLLSLLFLTYAGLSQVLRSNGPLVEQSTGSVPVGRTPIGIWATVFLGGFTFYTAVCLYCLVRSLFLLRSSEDWGLAMVLILGGWGIPVCGCAAAIFRSWKTPWSWLTTRVAWIAVCFEVLICAGIWLAMLMG